MRIAAFEGFYGGSHKKWLDGLGHYSSHEIHIFTLPARFWKWRMRGGAISLAKQFNSSGSMPDCLLVTDMIDLNILLSLIDLPSRVPVIFYMHENQLTYPWSTTDPDPSLGRDHHYAFVNYASCMAADSILFNSHYHKQAFLDSLPGFLRMFPDHRNEANIHTIRSRSKVLHLGLDLSDFDRFQRNDSGAIKTILWNHRWEYDKDPDTFFKTLYRLSEDGADFRLIVCGESTGSVPAIFEEARKLLAKHIDHWGTVDNLDDYAALLKKSDILPVTSQQDFFGISAVEAAYCGVYPLLPDRLAFVEHIPDDCRDSHIYNNSEDLYLKLKSLILKDFEFQGKEMMQKYDWPVMIEKYDSVFEAACAKRQGEQ